MREIIIEYRYNINRYIVEKFNKVISLFCERVLKLIDFIRLIKWKREKI